METFKQNLRSHLLSEWDRPLKRDYRTPFVLALTASMVLSLLSLGLVLRPEFAKRLHDAAGLSKPQPIRLDAAVGGEQLAARYQDERSDERLVAEWMGPANSDRHVAQRLNDQLVDEEIYAVRQYQVGDGRRVVVYSQLVGDNKVIPVTY